MKAWKKIDFCSISKQKQWSSKHANLPSGFVQFSVEFQCLVEFEFTMENGIYSLLFEFQSLRNNEFIGFLAPFTLRGL
jgi:hypothetical protein